MTTPVATDTFYKAVRPDGTSFHDPDFRWVPEDWDGETPITVRHHKPHMNDASGYLSVSVNPTDCTGMEWPCQLLRVEPVGPVWTPDLWALPNKRACFEWRVVERLDPISVFGPQGAEVVGIIERMKRLTPEEAARGYAAVTASRGVALDAACIAAWSVSRDSRAAIDAARAAIRDAVRNAARDSSLDDVLDDTLDAVWDVAWYSAWDSAWFATIATLVRDLISDEHYRASMGPWWAIIGEEQITPAIAAASTNETED